MSVQKRFDGTRIRNLPAFRIINPYVMKGRNESAIFYSQTIDIDTTHEFIRGYNKSRPSDERITLFHVILAAAVRTIALRPQLNRFVSGRHIYQRNRIVFSFIVKKELNDNGAETNAKITFNPFDTLAAVGARTREHVGNARDPEGNESDHELDFFSRLPRFLLNMVVRAFLALDYFGVAPKGMLELDPLFASAYIANLGSVGLDAPFHHLYEWGNTSIFLVIGRTRRKSVPVGTEGLENRLVLDVRYTIDDRITEGIYAAHSLQLFRDLVADPQRLLEKPIIDDAILKESRIEHMPEEIEV